MRSVFQAKTKHTDGGHGAVALLEIICSGLKMPQVFTVDKKRLQKLIHFHIEILPF